MTYMPDFYKNFIKNILKENTLTKFLKYMLILIKDRSSD